MLTLSRVMIPCDWMGIVTMRQRHPPQDIVTAQSGAAQAASPITLPRRKCTPSVLLHDPDREEQPQEDDGSTATITMTTTFMVCFSSPSSPTRGA